MTIAETTFIITTSIVLLALAVFVKKINWTGLGFKQESFFKGWWQILIFNIIIFLLVQLAITNKFIDLPNWMLDKDPILPLLAITFLQEILFRGIIINWLERWGQKKALWISVAIFVAFHLIAPYAWSRTGIMFAGLTFFAGYFWGLHFLKFRNIYLLAISHFLVNLSFNYIVFAAFF